MIQHQIQWLLLQDRKQKTKIIFISSFFFWAFSLFSILFSQFVLCLKFERIHLTKQKSFYWNSIKVLKKKHPDFNKEQSSLVFHIYKMELIDHSVLFSLSSLFIFIETIQKNNSFLSNIHFDMVEAVAKQIPFLDLPEIEQVFKFISLSIIYSFSLFFFLASL